MDRVYQSNAIETPPSTVASSGSYPTAGNKASGQLATVPGPYWFYSVTEEIRNAIIAMGLTPSSSSVDQLAMAFQKTVRTINSQTPDSNGNVDVASRNVGDEWHSFTGQIPAGGVPYCGQIVTRSTYADLWAYAQAQGLVKTDAEWQSIASAQGGNVPFYSSGDGSSTFRMPCLIGYIRGATSQSEAGNYIAEGLPNIGGNVYVGLDGTGFPSGSTDTIAAGDAKSYARKTTIFSASTYSSVYGKSSHVTPETSVVMFGVYAFGEIANTGKLDAETLANGLATVEANLEAKLDNGDKLEIVAWVTPDFTAGVSLSTNFVAPSIGWIIGNNGLARDSVCINYVNGMEIARESGDYADIQILINKGDTFTCTSGADLSRIKFYPCKGA